MTIWLTYNSITYVHDIQKNVYIIIYLIQIFKDVFDLQNMNYNTKLLHNKDGLVEYKNT